LRNPHVRTVFGPDFPLSLLHLSPMPSARSSLGTVSVGFKAELKTESRCVSSASD
jgi:hypothetical protein